MHHTSAMALRRVVALEPTSIMITATVVDVEMGTKICRHRASKTLYNFQTTSFIEQMATNGKSAKKGMLSEKTFSTGCCPLVRIRFQPYNTTMRTISLFAFLLVFSERCDLNDAPARAEELHNPLHIVATTFPVWLFTRNVTRHNPNTSVELLIPASVGCPHEYALTPRDRLKLANADVLVLNGLGMENFLKDSIYALKNTTIIDAGTKFAPPGDSGHDGKHGHHHSALNPHQFSSPARAAVMARAIADALAEADPANAWSYRTAADEYSARLTALAQRLADVGRATEHRGIVLQHDSLSALVADAGLDELAVIEEDGHPQSSTSALVRLTELLRSERPLLIAADQQYSDKIVVMLSKESGIPHATLDPVASGPPGAPPNWYETVMSANCQTLERYFARP
jgi:ABC-type Zn uptake system ZnuABC Zn-binding protein ZnuA